MHAASSNMPVTSSGNQTRGGSAYRLATRARSNGTSVGPRVRSRERLCPPQPCARARHVIAGALKSLAHSPACDPPCVGQQVRQGEGANGCRSRCAPLPLHCALALSPRAVYNRGSLPVRHGALRRRQPSSSTMTTTPRQPTSSHGNPWAGGHGGACALRALALALPRAPAPCCARCPTHWLPRH